MGQYTVDTWDSKTLGQLVAITCRQWDSKTVLKTGTASITCRQWDSKTVFKDSITCRQIRQC